MIQELFVIAMWAVFLLKTVPHRISHAKR